MMQEESRTRLQRAVDAALAVFLVALIFAVGAMTLFPNAERLYDSARLMRHLKNYLPEDYGAFDLFAARIRSFEAAYGNNVWRREDMGKINAGLQYALGKNIITTGAAQMATLPTGYLYDLQMPVDISDNLDEIIRFADQLDVPFTYIYQHPTNYAENKLPPGYAQLDWGDELGNEIVSTLRGAGIRVLDSRAALEGIPGAELTLRTDQHWTPYAALATARALAEELGLDADLLAPEAFARETFPKKFLGKYGQRIGVSRIAPDDFTVLWPTYDTDIARTTDQNGEISRASGPFRDSVIKWEFFEGEGWNIEAYKAYGLTENFEHYHNEAAKDVSLLLFKDSFGAPVGAFLSLVARDVYLVDMRKTDREAIEFVQELNPDQVIMPYSRQMVVLHEYQLFRDK